MLIEITAARSRQVVWAGMGPQLLINRDPLTAVYLGREGMGAADQQASILDPLGTLVVDGRTQLWAITAAGSALVDAVAGGAAWTPSAAQAAQQISQAIAGAGTPLLTGSALLGAVSQQSIPASGVATFGPWPVSQPGYDLQLALGASPASTMPVARIQLVWTDSASGLTVKTVTWFAFAGVNGFGPHALAGNGPSEADQFTVQFTNLDTVAMVASVSAFANSRIIPSHTLRTLGTLPPILNYAVSPLDTDDLALLWVSEAGVIAGGGIGTYALPLFAGPVTVHADISGTNTYGAELQIRSAADHNSSALIYDALTDATGNLNASLILPRAQCSLTLTNKTTTTQTLHVAAVGMA